MPDNERHIITRVLHGDRNAFKVLIERYQRLVMHIVFRMVDDPRDQEELAHDVFLKVHRNLAQFRYKSKFSTWIGRIAYNTCLNHLEKKRLLLYNDELKTPGDSFDEDRLGRQQDNEAGPEWMLIQSDLKAFVIKEVEKLPLEMRTALTLFYLESMSVAEISAIMSAPQGTVKSYLFRGRKKLKEMLLAKNMKEVLVR